MANRSVAIIGGGPAGLIAAETLAKAGCAVTIYDQMANPGRKFLLAGRGGLNLTHSDPLDAMLGSFGTSADALALAIEAFPPASLISWCESLNQPVFTGTSGRVFPKSMKASPLLRAWLARLGDLGVTLARGQRWTGWNDDGALAFEARDGAKSFARHDATVLALGGASWPKLGSDGAWQSILAARGVAVTPLASANCGIRIAWSSVFCDKFAGLPLKRIAFSLNGRTLRGEAVVTKQGLEGGVIYQLVPALRRVLAEGNPCTITLDLLPDRTAEFVVASLSKPAGKQTSTNRIRKAIGLLPAAISILRETPDGTLPKDPALLALRIKAMPLTVTGLEPIERAISSAGGIAWDEIDARYMLKRLPGVFAAGEMLDWEAPTGGYLLQACFSTGVAAANGVLAYFE